MSLIHQLVIRIHVCPFRAGRSGQPEFWNLKEHDCSTHWARSDQRQRSPSPIDQVVMAGERRRQKIRRGKKTKVTTANQNGNRPRAERPAPSQERIVMEPSSSLDCRRSCSSYGLVAFLAAVSADEVVAVEGSEFSTVSQLLSSGTFQSLGSQSGAPFMLRR